MTERLLLQPPEIVDTEGVIIFLAGPIQGAPDWQTEAISIIHGIDPSIIVALPKRDYPKDTFVYEKQVDWETYFLRKAGRDGAVMFWLAAQTEDTPGRAYAQTSRFELAEWKMHHEYEGAKLTLGIEEGFGNARYIRHRFSQDCPNVKIADNLADTCRNAIDLIHQAREQD